MDDTIVVTTQDSCADILAAGNSAAWSINLGKRGNELKYLVCARKGEAGQRRAFLVCEITGFAVDPDASAASARTKYAIEFRRFSRVDCPIEWYQGQNPVRFGQLSRLFHDRDIPRADRFETIGEKTLPYSYSRREPRLAPARGLTIAEAKRGLALTFGVNEDSIRIIVEH